MAYPPDFIELFPKNTPYHYCDNCKYNVMLFAQRQCNLPTCYEGCQCHVCINCHGCPGCCLMDYGIENFPEFYKIKTICKKPEDIRFTKQILYIERSDCCKYRENQIVSYDGEIFRILSITTLNNHWYSHLLLIK